MLLKLFFSGLISLVLFNSSHACRFDEYSRGPANDVYVLGFEGVCAGKNAFNQDCPYRQFLVHRIETKSCLTRNDGQRTDFKVYKFNKLVETYCEGDCKSRVKRAATPVCSYGVIVKNAWKQWKQAEKENEEKYMPKQESPDLFGMAKKLFF